MLHVLCTVYVKFLFVKYTREKVSSASETISSAENQIELENCDEKMKQGVIHSDKHSQSTLQPSDNLSKDDEDTC